MNIFEVYDLCKEEERARIFFEERGILPKERLYEDFKNLDRTIAFLQEKGLIHKEKLCRNGHSMKLRKRDDRYRWRCHNASCLLEVGLREDMTSNADEDLQEDNKDGVYYDDMIFPPSADVEILEEKEEIKIEDINTEVLNSASSSSLDATKNEVETSKNEYVLATDFAATDNSYLQSRETETFQDSDADFFRCMFCSYKSSRKDRMKRHVAAKHTDDKPNICSQCDYRAVEPATLARHIRTVHGGERKYPCPYCEHRFSESGNLRSHILAKHEFEKPYACDQCDYKAVQERWLKHHISVKHSMDRRFQCPFCPHSSTQLAHLKTHMAAKHTNDKPNICPHCPYRCVQKSVMKRHLRSKHSVEMPS